MNKILWIIIGISHFSSYSSSSLTNSIPKCGTFLLNKVQEQITGKQGVNIMHIVEDIKKKYTPSITDLTAMSSVIIDNGIYLTHIIYKPEYEQFFKENNIKICFIYRDPRDQLVAQTYHMLNHCTNRSNFDFDSLLLALIGDNDESPNNILYHYQEISDLTQLSSLKFISHIRRFYEGFIPWISSPYCYAVRFENLVGPQGGGSLDKQKQEIANIAKHIGFPLNDDKISEIALKLFGNSPTFREGKIESWKLHFKEKHINAFKKAAGDLLYRLGYKENW